MPVILVTEPEYRKAQTFFEQFAAQEPEWTILPSVPDEETFLQRILETRAWLAVIGMVCYSEAVYEALSRNAPADGTAVLTRFGVGMDNVDRDLAKKWNVRLANTPGVLDHSVAEHTLWLLGAAAKRLGTAHEAVRRGEFPSLPGRELFGKRLLIAGFGGIGRAAARIAHWGFGMEVRAFGRRSLTELLEAENAVSEAENAVSESEFLVRHGLAGYSNEIDEMLPNADAVCVLLASNSETRGFFNAERFEKMRRNVLFVNTSRGSLIDEDALFDFLTENPEAAASLDVFQTEPYVPQTSGKDLRTLPNVFLTPHLGSCTLEANLAIARSALAQTIQGMGK